MRDLSDVLMERCILEMHKNYSGTIEFDEGENSIIQTPAVRVEGTSSFIKKHRKTSVGILHITNKNVRYIPKKAWIKNEQLTIPVTSITKFEGTEAKIGAGFLVINYDESNEVGLYVSKLDKIIAALEKITK